MLLLAGLSIEEQKKDWRIFFPFSLSLSLVFAYTHSRTHSLSHLNIHSLAQIHTHAHPLLPTYIHFLHTPSLSLSHAHRFSMCKHLQFNMHSNKQTHAAPTFIITYIFKYQHSYLPSLTSTHTHLCGYAHYLSFAKTRKLAQCMNLITPLHELIVSCILILSYNHTCSLSLSKIHTLSIFLCHSPA